MSTFLEGVDSTASEVVLYKLLVIAGIMKVLSVLLCKRRIKMYFEIS